MIVTPIIPRVSETDGAGHINNCFVPIWFEAGRREIFRVFTPDLEFKQWRVALVNMNVDYEAQIFYSAQSQVHTWVKRVGHKSFTVGEEIWQHGKCCARGTAVYVYFDFELQKSIPLSADISERLQSDPYLCDRRDAGLEVDDTVSDATST
jgi:acyl-CoA thioester hydrolase